MRSPIVFANKSKNLLSFYGFCPYQLASECLQHTSVTRNEVGNVMLRNKTVKKFSNSSVKKQRVNKIFLTYLFKVADLIWDSTEVSEYSVAVLIQHCFKIVFLSILKFYHNIWHWNPLLNHYERCLKCISSIYQMIGIFHEGHSIHFPFTISCYRILDQQKQNPISLARLFWHSHFSLKVFSPFWQ